MIPVIVTKTLEAANAAGIAASQSLAGPGYVQLNGPDAAGGVAVLDTQRQVAITSAGNDSGITFTVTGTNQNGALQQQIIAGSNSATVATTLNFLTVTSIYASGATASTITVGTNGVGSSSWRIPNYHLTPFNIQFNASITGTVTYTVEYTIDDVVTPNATAIPMAYPTTLANETAAGNTEATFPFRAWRVTILSGTGTVTVEAVQAGIANY